jgi:hypothetical protein
VLEERWKLDQLHLFRSRLRASGPRKQPAQEIVRVCGELGRRFGVDELRSI